MCMIVCMIVCVCAMHGKPSCVSVAVSGLTKSVFVERVPSETCWLDAALYRCQSRIDALEPRQDGLGDLLLRNRRRVRARRKSQFDGVRLKGSNFKSNSRPEEMSVCVWRINTIAGSARLVANAAPK